MLFYFSGTGNSLQLAKNIAINNNDKLICISTAIKNEDMQYEYNLENNETVGFVFPIYAWAPPKMVLNFISNLKLNNFNNNYTYALATCGENIGNTMNLLNNCLKKININLNSGFSVKMPNNYIIIGDVYSKDKENKMLLDAENTMNRINSVIKNKTIGIFEIEKGHLPAVLTSIISPLFNKFAINTNKFYANDNCISCGICSEVCNCNTITLNNKPQWDKECSQCLACINLCPVKAIQFGSGTQNKGRYKNPNVSIEDLKIHKKTGRI